MLVIVLIPLQQVTLLSIRWILKGVFNSVCSRSMISLSNMGRQTVTVVIVRRKQNAPLGPQTLRIRRIE